MSGSDAAIGWRRSMAWLHTWLGLLGGWILFAMFLTGTASYFRPEITRWMQPEFAAAPVSPIRAAQTAIAHMQAAAPDATMWYVYLPDARTASTRIFVTERPATPPRPPRAEIVLDPATGTPLAARATLGGEHFYRFHFQLQLPYPWGRWLAGLAAMVMLTAIVSGVITHKRIFADFFTLRWGKGQRSWLDAHNASAVLALPFHATITYTGLIALMTLYMPWPVRANYAAPATFESVLAGALAETAASGRAAPLVPIAPLVRAAMREWRGDAPAFLFVRNPNDAAATILLIRSAAGSLDARTPSILYSGVDGRRLRGSPPPGPAMATAGVMLGLHMAGFAGPALRGAFFLLGLSGAAMVATGLLLWTAKRRVEGARPFPGFRLVERLNIAVIACLPAGMASYLLANRLIPAALPGRADLEVSAMFWVWFGLAAGSLVLPVRRAWPAMLGVAAAICAAVPLADAATTARGLPGSLVAGDTLFATVDLVMLALAASLGFAARRAARPPRAGRRAPASAARELTDAA